jgi:uracil-DNA glycosylase family 4
VSAEDDPRTELRSIAASLRAYLEWQLDSGATGIPKGERREKRPADPGAAAAVAAVAPSAASTSRAHSDFAAFAPRVTPPLEVPESSAPAGSRSAGSAPLAGFAEKPPSPPAMREIMAPSRETRDPESPPRSLPVLREAVASCTACGLASTRKNTVFSRGNPEAALVFIGEAPGADEDDQGIPFVGRAGQLLDKMIAAMGLSPEKDVYVCNIVKCRPPGNRKPEPEELSACFPFLDEQLANVKPKVLVAMGNTAVGALFNTKIGITKLRGEWKLYKGRIPTMPTYHPSYLLRPSDQLAEAKRQAWDDLRAVMKELGLPTKAR